MRKVIERLRRLWLAVNRMVFSAPTILHALSREVPYSVLKEVVQSDKQSSEYVSILAVHLQQPEQELMAAVARRMGINFVRKIPALEGHALQQFHDLEVYEQYAVFPLYVQGVAIGYACCDPSLAKKFDVKLKKKDMYLCTLSQLTAAIAESRAVLECARQTEDQKKALQLQRRLEMLLSCVVTEAEKHEVEKVQVRFTQSAVLYEFRLVDGRKGTGTIAYRWRNELAHFLSEISHRETMQFLNDSLEKIRVEILSPNECFMLNWSDDETLMTFYEEDFLERQQEEPLFLDFNPVADTNAESSVAKNSDEALLVPIRVLVIEDNVVFAKVLEAFLQKNGLSIKVAQNGVEALKILTHGEYRPDVIVSDIHMPGMDGFEFVQRIRTSENYGDLPILLLTSEQDVEVEIQLVSEGVDAYLSKSADPRLLIEYIKRFAQKKQSRHAIESAEAA